MELVGFSCAWFIPSFPNREMHKLISKIQTQCASKAMCTNLTSDLDGDISCNFHRTKVKSPNLGRREKEVIHAC
jgi:hypothetical protein